MDNRTAGRRQLERAQTVYAEVVHHGGAGTTGAGLRAGRPTVVVPMLADQPFWGERVEALGVGPSPVALQELTVERLAAAIRAAVERPEHLAGATSLAARLAEEDGAGAVLARIERLVP
ncbi:nucleotide disphospho-sugar-binding domain-containing protein [Dactylosporangium salmoneum]|uniref:nucleotide disphospho-sugar-binding domain-containing protein n=1 Tax=Dactylosporangium salmoneum TaxID=53361 RepID=UPI0031D10632